MNNDVPCEEHSDDFYDGCLECIIDSTRKEADALLHALVLRLHIRETVPQWEPLPTLRGRISQINNIVAGMFTTIDAKDQELKNLNAYYFGEMMKMDYKQKFQELVMAIQKDLKRGWVMPETERMWKKYKTDETK